MASKSNNIKKAADPQAAQVNKLKRELKQTRRGLERLAERDIKVNTKRPGYIPKSALGESNRYLASLLDPEGVQGVRYPDGFSQRTAMVPGLVNQNIPYFPSTCDLEPPGSFNLIVRPSAVHPVWTYAKQKIAKTHYSGFVDEQATYGIFPLKRDQLLVGPQIGNMILPNATTVNVKYPMTFPECDWQQEPYQGLDPSGNLFYGQPITGFSTAPSIAIRAKFDGMGVAIGDSVKFDLIDAAGNTATATVAAAATGQEVFQPAGISLAPFLIAESDTEIALGTPRPGIGIRLTLTTASGRQWQMTSFNVFTLNGTPTVAKYASMPYDLEDQDKFLSSVDQYRLISQSALLTYMGATLTDGGQISSMYYLGGAHPNELGFWKYSEIAEAVNQPHTGSLKKGTYVIWKPKDTKDMQMRDVVNPTDWEHPYLVIAGVVSSPDIVNVLRLRVFANYEVVTKSMFLNQAYGADAPGKIRQALIMLKTFPMAGENDTHLENIRRLLGKAWDVGKKVVNWGYDNRGWLVPAAGALAALL